MRSLLFAALLGGVFSAAQLPAQATAPASAPTTAQAKPPGYRAPRRLFAAAQPYRRLPLRLSVGLNTAYYSGDITTQFGNNTFRPGFGLGMVQTITPRLSLGLEASYFQLKATDSQPDRGLSFSSSNYLLVPFLRLNLFADKSMYLGTKYADQQFQIYVQAGAGFVRYDPKAYQSSTGKAALLPESKAGYPATAGAFPAGLGLSYRASKGVYLVLEGLYYFTTTDLLDDVSLRGDSKTLDQFAVATLKMEFTLPQKHGKPLVHPTSPD